MFKKILLVSCVLAAAVLAVSCAPAPAPTPAPEAEAEAAADAALRVSGLAEKAWSLADLQALPQSESDYTNKDGETTTFSGVRFAELLAAAVVGDYASVTLVASDEYAIEIDRARLDACGDCLVAISDDGSLRSVMPGFEGMFQVRNLVALEVK
jgi:hypothetical protein